MNKILINIKTVNLLQSHKEAIYKSVNIMFSLTAILILKDCCSQS